MTQNKFNRNDLVYAPYQDPITKKLVPGLAMVQGFVSQKDKYLYTVRAARFTDNKHVQLSAHTWRFWEEQLSGYNQEKPEQEKVGDKKGVRKQRTIPATFKKVSDKQKSE